ncbi:hypothetical protein ACFSMW_00665 [Virgibacillus halophilus]
MISFGTLIAIIMSAINDKK